MVQFLYHHITGESPSELKGASRPVESVSWYDALHFCNALSREQGYTEVYSFQGSVPSAHWSAKGWRLPTEAEWEYAARAGTELRYAGSSELDDVAWFWDNGGAETHPVGQKKPNQWGLYDMSGNVFEWCWDGYDPNFYMRSEACKAPTGSEKAVAKSRRGGGWHVVAGECELIRRFSSLPVEKNAALGFRIVRAV